MDTGINDLLNALDEAMNNTVTTATEPQVSNLSEQDFNDILTDMGFEESEESSVEVEVEVNRDNSIVDNETDVPMFTPSVDDAVYSLNIETSPQDGENGDTEENTEEVSHNENYIEPNSPTILIDNSTSRFSGTEWYNEVKKQKVILAGCGGIGSWTALLLARMCPERITLYDDDVVEEANMSGQLYGRNNIGTNKVDALYSTINYYTNNYEVYAVSERYTSFTPAEDIMICGFDNMLARREFFNSWKERVASKPYEEKCKCLFVDGRLSIDTLQVFCIRGDDTYNMERYERDFLFSDEEAEETLCSMKQTTYLACMIGSVIVNLFTNHVANILNPIIPYDLPFFTEYDSKFMLFKTEG